MTGGINLLANLIDPPAVVRVVRNRRRIKKKRDPDRIPNIRKVRNVIRIRAVRPRMILIQVVAPMTLLSC